MRAGKRCCGVAPTFADHGLGLAWASLSLATWLIGRSSVGLYCGRALLNGVGFGPVPTTVAHSSRAGQSRLVNRHCRSGAASQS